VIPELDNVVFGLIAIDGVQVTAADSNVWVDVKRSASDEVLYSYRMGKEPKFGDYYAVEIPMAFPGRAGATNGEVVRIMVRDTALPEADFVVGGSDGLAEQRGYAERIDFGEIQPLIGFDAWPELWGLATESGALDADADGVTNYDKYIAGTDPTDPESQFAFGISQTDGSAHVVFIATQAQGRGYEGLIRFFSLEAMTDLGSEDAEWTPVEGYTDILGNDEAVSYLVTDTDTAPEFYRVKIELRPVD
jgi:hypothetical protein